MGICGLKSQQSTILLIPFDNEKGCYHAYYPIIDYCQIPNDIHQSKKRYNELMDQDPSGLVGISNLGNTCFINSALQCLLNVQPLIDYFLSDLHLHEVNKNNPLGSQGRITQAFAELVNMIWCSNDKYIVPNQFLKTIRKFSPIFGDGSQQDSQEFLIFLLDLLHEDLNRVKVKPIVDDKDYQSNEYESYAAESWKSYLLRNKSVVVDLFQGQLKSTLKCLNCETVSHKFDTFMYLSVPIPQSNKNQSRGVITIDDCIEEFTKEEELDRSEWWFCTKCKKRTPSTKKIDLWKTPNILIVHLKRFQYTRNNRGKINTFIDFKITQFDLSQKVSGKEKMRPIYDLFAVSNHSGNLGGGHYTAYAKNRDTQDWYLFDDSKVHYVKNPYKEIISQKAYVLFYSKTSIDKFQRQTISRPEFWPHFLNNSHVNQHSLLEASQNQKKSFSALSIQKQDSRANQQNILSQNNIPSVKSTPQQNGKQMTNQINIFDDENRQNLEKSGQQNHKKSYIMAPIQENRILTDGQEKFENSPIIKGIKQQENFNESDFMPSVIVYNNRAGSFNKKQQNQQDSNKKDHNLSNFIIKPYPVNSDEKNNQNKNEKAYQTEVQDLSRMSNSHNENSEPKQNMFKVKRISVNKKTYSNEKLLDQNENSSAQKEMIPNKVQLRNQKNSMMEEYCNSEQASQYNMEGNIHQAKEEDKRQSQLSYYNNIEQNTPNKYSQNQDHSPHIQQQQQQYYYHNSSMGEMPSITQNQYKIKNGQYIPFSKVNNDQYSNDLNQSMELNQKQRNGKYNQTQEYNDFYTKPQQNNIYANRNKPRIQDQDYSDYAKGYGGIQTFNTTLNTQISNDRQNANLKQIDKRYSERKGRNPQRNNDLYQKENVGRQSSQSNFLDIYQENESLQQQYLQQNQQPYQNKYNNNVSTQQRHLSYDQAGNRRNKYSNFTPEKHKYDTQSDQNKLPSAVAAQMLIDKKLSIIPKNNVTGNSLENKHSQDSLFLADSSSKNKITNTSLIEPRQILAGGFTQFDLKPSLQQQQQSQQYSQQNIFPSIPTNHSESLKANLTSNSTTATYDSSPSRNKKYTNGAVINQNKYPAFQNTNQNNFNTNISTFNSAQKNYHKNI